MDKSNRDNELLDMGLDFYSYNISGHWLSAIVNGDYSGLTDEEEKQLNDFLDEIPTHSHIDVDPEKDSPGFSKDEISGLYSDCYTVRAFI